MIEHKPFIGIGGVGSLIEFGEVIDAAMDARVQSIGHTVMIGVNATAITQIIDQTDYAGPYWHPVGDAIRTVAGNEDSGLTMTMVDCRFGRQPDDIAEGVDKVRQRTMAYMRGLKLNGLTWLYDDYAPLLNTIKERHAHQPLIVSANVIDYAEVSTMELVRRVLKLPVDYVSFEASDNGYSAPVDYKPFLAHIKALNQLGYKVVLSGCIDETNLRQTVEPVMDVCPDVSCISEAKLRIGPLDRSVLNTPQAGDVIREWTALHS